MITITDNPGYLTVAGHAGTAPDITCEGVTILLLNLIASLEELTDDPIEYMVEKGNALLTYGYPSERARLLIDSFFLGVEEIAKLDPDKVRVSRQERHKTF